MNWNAVAPAPTNFFWETYAIFFMPAVAHLASKVAHGVFRKWPDLYYVAIEHGLAWAPSVVWRRCLLQGAAQEDTLVEDAAVGICTARHLLFDAAAPTAGRCQASLVDTQSHGRREHADGHPQLTTLGL